MTESAKTMLSQIKNEMDQLLNSFTLVGKGNTDFRPVFSYVNDLIDQKVFQNLCGLLYFTDGKGIYPKKESGL